MLNSKILKIEMPQTPSTTKHMLTQENKINVELKKENPVI